MRSAFLGSPNVLVCNFAQSMHFCFDEHRCNSFFCRSYSESAAAFEQGDIKVVCLLYVVVSRRIPRSVVMSLPLFVLLVNFSFFFIWSGPHNFLSLVDLSQCRANNSAASGVVASAALLGHASFLLSSLLRFSLCF